MKILTQMMYGVFVFVLLGCHDTQSIYVSSRIDQSLTNYITSIDEKTIIITIQSSGGDTRDAARLGAYLLTKNLSIDVHDYCHSACAEFILPAADTITFTNKPLVGFHWSPIMDYHQYVRAGADMSICHFDSLADQRKLIKTRKLNAEFWKQTETHLNLTKYKLVGKGEACPWKIREFKNKMWLPTSQQLRELWDLKFEGAVCADNFEECKTKIDGNWTKGSRIVVGDVVYISK